jgi:hypothetical protein
MPEMREGCLVTEVKRINSSSTDGIHLIASALNISPSEISVKFMQRGPEGTQNNFGVYASNM